MERLTGEAEEAGILLSPWWRNAAILVLVPGFMILIWIAVRSYQDAPPIPVRVVGPAGETLFPRIDIVAGQQVFLKHGIMENGTVWGHGADLGPDFSAKYLQELIIETRDMIARERFNLTPSNLDAAERDAVDAETGQLLKQNCYDPQTGTLTFTPPPEAALYLEQIAVWTDCFSKSAGNGGLPAKFITAPHELRQFAAFFAGIAWASIASRLGMPYSYTNNFPYDRVTGNSPTSDMERPQPDYAYRRDGRCPVRLRQIRFPWVAGTG
jgi:nitric oxide reductase subunit B